MAKSMNGQLPMFDQLISADSRNAISSLELAVGVTLSDLRAGQMTAQSGPEAVPASRGALPERKPELTTPAISGPHGTPSLRSATLQSSLENRLRARLPVDGSPEFVLTWKQRTMPLGPSISALVASPRPISDSGCTSWPTPVANDDNKTPEAHLAMKARMGGNRTAITPLQVIVKAIMCGWPTPTAITNTGGAALCKWGGTRSRQRLREAVGNTVLNGALNPAFPCWLMGYPDEWISSVASVMQSFPKSHKPSSKRT